MTYYPCHPVDDAAFGLLPQEIEPVPESPQHRLSGFFPVKHAAVYPRTEPYGEIDDGSDGTGGLGVVAGED